MTLNLTIVSDWGIWQCSDHRLVDPTSSRLIDDYSAKQVHLICTDGSCLLAYAGAGRVRDVDLSDWIRETLRGESRTLDQSLVLIRENSTRDLAPILRAHKILHMFSIGAVLGTRRWIIQIRNFDAPQPDIIGAIRSDFVTVSKEIVGAGEGFIFGARAAVKENDRKKLKMLAARKPRTPKDYRKLLAAINRRASETAVGLRTISPHCSTAYLPLASGGIEAELHGGKTDEPIVVPTLLFGIDLTDGTKTMLMRMAALKAGKTPEENLALRDPVFVVPKNRIRRT